MTLAASMASYACLRQSNFSPAVEDEPNSSLPSISNLLKATDSTLIAPASKCPPLPVSFSIPTLLPGRPRTRTSAHTGVDSWLHTPSYDLSINPPIHTTPTTSLHPISGFHSSGGLHSPSGKPTVSAPLPQLPRMSFPDPTQRSPCPYQGSANHDAAPYITPASSVSSRSPVRLPPLPSSTAAATAATWTVAQQPLMSPVTPVWHHHHYFPSSSSTCYQQNQNRYICHRCQKAFSRPSSLRTHTHIHTGEKPFRCTRVGCGKAFSVRSNLKRHERGGHGGRPVATATV